MACKGAADEMHDQPQRKQNYNDAYQLSHKEGTR